MQNRILKRWGDVCAGRETAAVLAPTGECLRTWAEIDEESRSLARMLEGDPGGVALQTGNHPAFPAWLLACLRSGRAACLLDTEVFGEARTHVEKQLGITVRIEAGRGRLDVVPAAGARPAAPDAAVVYKLACGSSPWPQPVGFTADQLVADADQVCGTMGIRDTDINYGVIPFAHSYGFSNLVTPLLCRGVRLVVAEDPLPHALESGLAATGATILPAVPAMFRGLLSASALPPALRLCVSAGTRLDPGLADQFREKFHRKIHSFYGTTECGGICFDGSPDRQAQPGFIGQPLEGVAIEMPSHPEGAKICVRSAAIGGCPAAPACQPSDLLVRQADGFRIVGRDSDWINVAGKKVSPAEVERVLGRFPGISDVLVCGVEDTWRGQEICALIAAASPIDRSALRRHCAARIAAWKCPRRFEFRSAIPEGPTGRINRAEAGKLFSQPTRERFISSPPEKAVMDLPS